MFEAPEIRERNIFINKYILKYTKKEGKNVLYIHTPFCLRKCRYCVYHSETVTSYDDVAKMHYEFLLNDIKKYHVIFEQVTFDEVYFGGGTPTLIPPEQMLQIFNIIPKFKDIPNKCIEASPETLTDKHLELLTNYSFNFLSIGIQSLNKKICEKQNRFFFEKPSFVSLCKRIESYALPYNLDFICFMDNGDIRDIRDFKKDILYVLQKVSPSFITIQSLYQSVSTIERSKLLIKMVREILEENPQYICVNSLLNDEDSQIDAMYNTEYRIGLKGNSYSHYLFNKYSTIPIRNVNLLSIGDMNLFSNAGVYTYEEKGNKGNLYKYSFDSFIFDSYDEIRASLHKSGLL